MKNLLVFHGKENDILIINNRKVMHQGMNIKVLEEYESMYTPCSAIKKKCKL